MKPPSRLERAGRLAGYFDLQLVFAARMAERAAMPLAEAVSRFTNLHRRFGLGDIDLVPPSPAWADYLDRLVELEGADERLAWTKAVYISSPEDQPPAGRTAFGCFACDPPNAQGVMRIHFYNRDAADGVGPLDRRKVAARTAELAAMFDFVRRTHPDARSVLGGSWLYNLQAYRRLFPPEYGASRRPPETPPRLSGTSSWGQFLDHRDAFKPELGRRLLERMDALDPAAPSRSFPLLALRASASIERFYAFYGL
jgi:HAMP domain-containing protein